MKTPITLFLLLSFGFLQAQHTAPLVVKHCEDFDITGKGVDKEWEKTKWVTMKQLDAGPKYATQFKILYSVSGIYVLFQGEDKKITSPYQNDFDPLFLGDVFEVFFHTAPGTPIYLEYEISPLNKELVLLVPNLKGKANGWVPYQYKDKRKTKKAVFTNGASENGDSLSSWSAEVFLPYILFNPLENVPPRRGTVWKANFYRLDYDSGKMIKWAWTPVNQSFHEFEKYQPIRFE